MKSTLWSNQKHCEEGTTCCACVHVVHIPAWYTARWTCWRSAFCVGNILSTDRLFRQNRSSLVSFTEVLVLSHRQQSVVQSSWNDRSSVSCSSVIMDRILSSASNTDTRWRSPSSGPFSQNKQLEVLIRLRLLGFIEHPFSWEILCFFALSSLVLLNFKRQDLCQEARYISNSEAVTLLPKQMLVTSALISQNSLTFARNDE